MVISVREVSIFADTNTQGDALFNAVNAGLQVEDVIKVDFAGISNATSSFMNSSFVRLLASHDFETIRRRIMVVGANRQIAALIKARMEFEAANKGRVIVH